MENEVFYKIVTGELPCHKIYEDETVLAFLDIHPAAEGHSLVIPKNPTRLIWDHSDKEYADILLASKKVAARIQEVVKPHRMGIMLDGGEVHYTHVHLLPLMEDKGVKKTLNSQDLTVEADHTELAKLAERLRF